MKRVCLSLASMAVGATLCGGVLPAVAADAPSFEAMRTQMLNRPRTMIYNTDGNDMTLYPRALPLTPEAFESVRLKYTEGTKIDSVFYCPHSSAFGWFTTRKTHDFMTTQFRPPDAEVYNAAADFAKTGTDALEMAAAYCRRRGLEIFVSIRMNDTHDNRGPQPPNSHFSLFKQQHPECRHYCADPMRFLNMPKIDPQRPLKLAAGETYAFDLVVGDDLAACVPAPGVTADVLTDAKEGPDDALALSVNGNAVERTTHKKGLFTFSVPAKNVKKGANAIVLTAVAPLRIADFALRITQSQD